MPPPGLNTFNLSRIGALFLCILLVCSSVQSASALPQRVDVNIFSTHSKILGFTFLGPARLNAQTSISLPEGQYQLRVESNNRVRVWQVGANGKLRPVLHGDCIARANYVDFVSICGLKSGRLIIACDEVRRVYAGSVSVSLSSGVVSHMVLTNHVSRRDYIAGVCAAEMPLKAGIEALKAQAVLANCMIARNNGVNKITDSTQLQAYSGVPVGRPEIREAVKAVGEQVLLFDGKPIHPYFHSTCAGRTSAAVDIFNLRPGSYPYLQSVECQYCKESPFWKHTISRISTASVIEKFGGLSPRVEKYGSADRVTEIGFYSAKSNLNKKMSGYEFWTLLGQKFGWSVAPGNIFSMKKEGIYLLVDSRGAGHGVGMCQWGAIGMADAGKNYRQILSHYFVRTTLSQ